MQRLALIVLLLLHAGAAGALDPELTIAQYEHRSWARDVYAPKGIVAFAQTTDGWLWWANDGGPGKFDGQNFTPVTWLVDVPAAVSSTALASADGALWIGYELGGVLRRTNAALRSYDSRDGLPEGKVHALVQDQGGTIWAATEGGVARFVDGRWQQMRDWHVASAGVYGALVAKDDTLWFATVDAVVSVDPARSTVRIVRSLPPVTKTKYFAQAPDGRIFLSAPGTGVLEMNSAREAWFAKDNVGPLLVDQDGNLWMAGEGLRRLVLGSSADELSARQAEQRVEVFSRASGLSGDRVTALFEDRFGSLWVATSNGLDHFMNTGAIAPTLPQGMRSWGTQTIVDAGDGAVWMAASGGPALLKYKKTQLVAQQPAPVLTAGTRGANGEVWFAGPQSLVRIQGEQTSIEPLPMNLRGHDILAMTHDGADGLWISIDKRGVFRRDRAGWSFHGGVAGLPNVAALAASTAANGDVWLGYANNTLARITKDGARVFTSADGIAIGAALVLTPSADGLWIGGELGLAMFDGHRFHDIEVQGGPGLRSISGIVENAAGDLWIYRVAGLSLVKNIRHELVAGRTAHLVQLRRHYGPYWLDAQPDALRSAPAMLQTSDGRFWFSDRDAPKSVSLRYLIDLEVPQPTTGRGELMPTIPEINGFIWSTYGKDGVRFGQYTPYDREIRMDARDPMDELSPDATLELPPHTRDVEFLFSAPTQQRPRAVTFKTRLVGSSDRWSLVPVPGNDRAIFRNLGPGKYRFEVGASVTNAREDGPAATLEFEILPAFYQTAWFRWLCALTALAALALIFRMQLRRAAGRLREKLEARMSERERIARELHDTLLQGVQGLIMKINAASLQMREHEPARETLDQALDAAEQVLVEGRDRVASLRESGNFERDLTNDIASIGERLAEDHSIAFRASVHGVTRPLHPVVQEEAFLIVREALHNAFRHAGARHITTNVFFDRQALRIEVSDDGHGISKEVLAAGGRMGHWGLAGMRERARRIRAALELKSDIEHGTQVELRVKAAVAYKSQALKLPWLSLRTSVDTQPSDWPAREKMD